MFNKGWKIVFKYFLEYKKDIVTIATLVIISALANGATPYVVGKFFDSLISVKQINVLSNLSLPNWTVMLGLWFLIQVVVNITDFKNEKTARRTALEMHTGYLSKIASHLISLPISFHKEEKHGEIWNKVNKAGDSIWSIISNIIMGVGPETLTVFVGLFFAFSINTTLTLVIIVGLVIYLLIFSKIVPPIAVKTKAGHEAWHKAYGVAYDAVVNFQTIKQSTAEKYESDKIRKMFNNFAFKKWFEVEQAWIRMTAFQRITVMLVMLGIFSISAFYVQEGVITIGSLIALNSYAAMALGPFVRLGYSWNAIQNGLVAIEKIEEINEIHGEGFGIRNKKKIPFVHGQITFENVYFKYKKGDPEILSGISFNILPGEIIAFVGGSGVGKTTITDLLGAYYFPTKGNIFIDEVKTEELDVYDLRKNIAIVPQETVLFNETIEDNIKYGNQKASKEQIIEAARQAYALEFIEKFPKKWKQLVGERGIKLSVGQKQRVAIARAILRNPKILILDEPTSALDAHSEKHIQESLESLMKGRTTIIIAHRLSTVRKANKIIVLKEGKIAEIGTHEELILKPDGEYRKLYDFQIGLM